MKTLQIDESKAKKLYKESSDEFKAMLEDTFTKEFFSEAITDRVKTFQDACDVLEITEPAHKSILTVHSRGLDKDLDSINAYAKLIIIARALNEGWEPDWTDGSQYKYVPWFEHKAGFGLSFFVYDFWRTVTNVGSRLCFKTSDLAKYAGTQFAEIYKDYLTL